MNNHQWTPSQSAFLKAYEEAKNNDPIFLYGPSGSGKSYVCEGNGICHIDAYTYFRQPELIRNVYKVVVYDVEPPPENQKDKFQIVFHMEKLPHDIDPGS